MNYVLLVLGFIFLVQGANIFVDGSSSIAKRLKISGLIIGLTIVAFGTSAPEAAVSISAALTGQNGISIGNVLGSNIVNLLLVIGICAIIRPLKVEKSIIAKEFPFFILSCIVLVVMFLDKRISGNMENILSRGDGLVLIIFFAMFIYSLIMVAISSRTDNDGDDIVVMSTGKSILFSIFGMIGVILGGKLVVDSASSIAQSFGLTEELIGLTIVAIGTSLPEIVTSVIATRKGSSDMALGNAIGSNIFNTLFVLGTSAIISPIVISDLFIYDLIFLTIVGFITYIFAFTRKTINKWEGFSMLGIYIAYTIYIIMR